MTTAANTSGAAEMTDRVLTASLDKLIAALPAAAHAAMQKTLPDKYTPELADEIASSVIAELVRTRAEELGRTGASA